MLARYTPSRIVFNVFNYTLMVILSVFFIAPLWHVIMASISDPKSLMAHSGLILFPLGKPTFQGYKLVLSDPTILTGYANTLIYVVSTTVLGTILTLLGGFVISRKDLKLKVPITAFILFTMMFGGGLIPTYMVVKWLGLIGHRTSIIIPGVLNAFFIVIMKSAFEQLPASYEESAKLDGAGPMTVMTKILAPLVKATIAVIVLFTAVMQWNSWFQASIYISTQRDLWPLQLVMREILVQNDSTKIINRSVANDAADLVKNLVKYSVVIVGTLPILCIYPFVQKYFVQGIQLGGVKG